MVDAERDGDFANRAFDVTITSWSISGGEHPSLRLLVEWRDVDRRIFGTPVRLSARRRPCEGCGRTEPCACPHPPSYQIDGTLGAPGSLMRTAANLWSKHYSCFAVHPQGDEPHRARETTDA